MRQLSTRTPAVRRGKPELKERYETSTINGIVIWHAQGVLPQKEIITISLEKHWFFKELVISGAESSVLSI